MIPIQQLLSRIRWDEGFAQAGFVIGYYDRVEERIIKVSFKELIFPAEDHFGFELVDQDGSLHSIPYHRVKELYRDGKLIWHREH